MTQAIELISGPRFAVPAEWFDKGEGVPGLRSGSYRTFLIDMLPISGPIVRRNDPDGGWYAKCLGCPGDLESESKFYSRKMEPALFRWAAKHRCKPRSVNFIGFDGRQGAG